LGPERGGVSGGPNDQKKLMGGGGNRIRGPGIPPRRGGKGGSTCPRGAGPKTGPHRGGFPTDF